MFNRILFSFFLIIFPVQAVSFYENDPLDNMPILKKLNPNNRGAIPIEQRDAQFINFLAASVRIDVFGSSGSGTIVYYDSKNNIAYVASCGHLFTKGTMSQEEGLRRKLKCKIIPYYNNDKKLDKLKSYDGEVKFYSYISGQDTSLIAFTPDWTPNYFPIAPKNYIYQSEIHAHSLGSDGRTECAHYDVTIIGISGYDLVTKNNSPRPGRSGGGLMDDNGYYIGTCWGTEYVNGSGRGFFTPVSVIHNYWGQQKDYSFLLEQEAGIAKKIPVIDRVNSGKKYNSDYILIPFLHR